MEQRFSNSLWKCTASGPDGQFVRLQSLSLTAPRTLGMGEGYPCARQAQRAATLSQDTVRLFGDLVLTPARVRASSRSVR